MSKEDSGDLAFATFDELVDEIARRSENCVVYAEHFDRGAPVYDLRTHGDKVRLYGAIQLRVLAEIKKNHDDAMAENQ